MDLCIPIIHSLNADTLKLLLIKYLALYHYQRLLHEATLRHLQLCLFKNLNIDISFKLTTLPDRGNVCKADKRVAVSARKVGFIRENKTRRDLIIKYFCFIKHNRNVSAF